MTITIEPILEVTEAVRQANQQFMKAFRQGDPVRVAGMYAVNALLCPPGADMMEGTGAIARFWKGAMNMGITEVTLETICVETFDSAAVEVGNYTLLAGNEAVDNGKYLVVWRLEDGTWKLYRDIWNTSMTRPTT